MIKVLIGNILESPMAVKVNTVNCVGVMGKGIALEFKKQYPAMFDDYVQRCRDGEVKPGVPYLYTDLFGEKIINFPTKDHWKALSNIDFIINGLDIFIEHYREWGIESVAFSPLGCGNGGLEWAVVGPIMYQKLLGLEIAIEIYAPFSTNIDQLKPSYLMGVNTSAPKTYPLTTNFPAGWIAILEILSRLEKNQYASYVGRIMFQKICYTATLQGLDTGFVFRQGTYGPFSSQVKDMYKACGNANLLSEQQCGSLLWIKTGSEYQSYREKVIPIIEKHENDIKRAVDLFSRIKGTDQAEEVATVLFTLEELNKNIVNEMTSEKELFDHIIKWKKHWNTQEKIRSIASTIRNLAMLGWIKLDYSDSLPVTESEFS